MEGNQNNQNLEKKDPSNLQTIRTYKNDVSEYVKKEGKTLADIAIAEQDRRYQNSNVIQIDKQAQKTNWVKIGIIVAILALIIGIFLWLQSFLKKIDPNAPTETHTTETQIFDFGMRSKDLNLENLNQKYVFDSIDTALRQTGDTYYLNIFYKGEKVSALKTLELLNIYTPSNLARSLKEKFALGNFGGSRFLILKTSYYSNAFAGMLKWEEEIYNDLREILILEKASSPFGTGTTTADYEIKKTSFFDGIISNRDARILKDPKQKTLLIYTFLDNETILIAPNENTLKVVAEKATLNK
jgi:hypothetical protein